MTPGRRTRGGLLALIMGPGWFAAPTFLPAWIFAIVTIAAGWFLMQPAMGLGWAASATPDPRRARVMGLLAHTAFGVGLWGTAVVGGKKKKKKKKGDKKERRRVEGGRLADTGHHGSLSMMLSVEKWQIAFRPD